MVKEIEADTYEENPPLFRKYISAAPDVKSNMDNQFKNVKTHARLLSKAMWYEWRMKLLDGLKEGLVKIGEGMNDDDLSLTQQEQMMQPVLPSLIEQHERLESEVQTAQAQADELADCDQDELRGARQELMSVERDLESKQKLLHQLQSQLREKENILGDVIERKQECVDEIKEAEKVRQDCRGWSSAEVSALQGIIELDPMSHLCNFTKSSLISQCHRPRGQPWLDYHFNHRLRPHNDSQQHPSTLLHAIFLPAQRRRAISNAKCGKFPYKPDLRCRCPPLSSPTSNNREAIFPTNHARAAPMPAAIPNDRQGSPSLCQQ